MIGLPCRYVVSLLLFAAFPAVPVTAATTAPGAALPCGSLTQAKLKDTQVLSVSEVVGALPAPDRVVPSWEGSPRDVGSAALLSLPAFCRVIAVLSPVPKSRIVVELWLPKQWNGKLLGIGNHGFAGEFERDNMAMGLNRGYAVVATDAGHSIKDSPEAEFSVGNEAAVDDFAWRAIHDMTVTAKALVQLHYGSGARRSYFDGCSNGGRQALREAQQFPNDYDGIVAGGAAIDWTRAFASTMLQYKAGLLESGGQITRAKLRLARNAAVAACDRADGLADGLINDPQNCHWEPRGLLCKTGDDQDSCLTLAEAAVVERLESTTKDPRTGAVLVDRMLPGSSDVTWANVEKLNRHIDSYFRLMVMHDTKRSPLDVDISELLQMANKPGSESMRIVSVNPDLSAFRSHGGKLIQYHGWNDQSFPPDFITRYYAEVVDLQPGADKLARTQEFYRLFMVPGMAHCRGGYGPVNLGGLDHLPLPVIDADHDALEALDRWVDKGAAPETIIATEFVDEKAAQRAAKRQMPLCPFPKVASYVGGDANRAESFACKAAVRK